MLFRDGALIGQASGRLGPVVASRNRYGSYFRAGTIPITSTTSYAMNAKAYLTNASQSWRTLTTSQRNSWKEWANQNPVVNRIGQIVNLSGQAAYVGLYCIARNLALTPLSAPPISSGPAPLLGAAATFDIGAGDFGITWTNTPLGASESLWLNAAVVNSAGINYVKDLLRFIGASDTAEASGYDPQAQIEARFGTLVVGQKVVLMAQVVDQSTMLLSTPIRLEGTVVTT